MIFAVLTKFFAIGEGLLPEDPRLTRFCRFANLEKGLLLGAVSLVAGGRTVAGVDQSMATDGFWPAGLLTDDALGDTDGFRRADNSQ